MPQIISIMVNITKNLIILRNVSRVLTTLLQKSILCLSLELGLGENWQMASYSSSVTSIAFALAKR